MLPQKPVLPSSPRDVRVEARGAAPRAASAGSPGRMLNSVGMSVEPWMLAWPRSAMMPPPGRPMLPSSSLQDRGGADHLRADAVVGPADGVAEGGGALAAAVAGQRVGDLRELLGLDAADLLHHLRGVAREVPLEDLEDAARVLQRLVAVALPVHRRAAGAVRLGLRGLVRAAWRVPLASGSRGSSAARPLGRLVAPGRRVVVPGLRVEAGEQPVEVLGVLERPRRRSSRRWCRPRRTRGSRGRCSARG